MRFIRAFALLVITAASALAARTVVTDTLYFQDGTKYNGTIYINASNTFQASDGNQVKKGVIKVQVLNGLFTVNLEPTDTAIPAGSYYQVNYQLTNGLSDPENWLVPTSGSPVGLAAVRTVTPPAVSFVIALSQLGGAIGNSGLCIGSNGSSWVPVVCGTGGASEPVNLQVGTTYTFLNGDLGKLVSFTNASPIAATLPQAGAGSAFLSGWYADVQNRGAGTLTITPTISTIDGAASLSLTTGQGVRIASNGTNYFTQRGMGSGGGAGVTSVGLTAPAWFTVGGSPVTTSGTLALTPATGQTSHQVIGTCGSATSFTTCALVLGDLPSIANNTVLGNTSGGSAAPSAVDQAHLTALVNPFSSTLSGAATASGGGTTNFLRADGSWTAPSGAGGANTSLSNLAAVSINTALIPQTGIDAGSVAAAFRNVYIYGSGTFSTTSLKLDGTPTGNRIVTFPDATDTVVMLGVNQILTNKTLTTPTIGSFTNATHNHTNAAGGGTLTLAGAAFANQGTTTTLLHGNAAGNPAFSAVDLANDVTGNLGVAHLNSGTGASSTTFLRGDNTWAIPVGTTNPAQLHTVTFSTTPAFTCTSGSNGTVELFELSTTLTANITPTISGCTSGQMVSFRFKQDVTGGRSVTWPAAWNTLAQPSPLASIETTIVAVWDGTSGKGSATSDGQGTCPEQAAPGVSPPAGSEFPWCDSTGLFPRWRNSSGTIFQAAKELSAGNVRVAGGANAVDTAGTAHSIAAIQTCTAASASGTAYTCTTSPTFAPAAGDEIIFKADVANTGSATLNVNASSAATIKKQGGGTNLVANDLLISQQTLLTFDGTNWQMQGQTGNAASGSSLLSGTLAAIPATCTVGASIYQATDQPITLQLYACTATNTWTRQDYTQGTTASKPATCSVGQVYFSTDATAGQNWFFCTATNTWTQQLNSGGGGTNMCSDMFTTPGSITFNVTAGHVNCITVSGTYTVTAAVALANANVSIVALTPGVIIKQLTAGTDLFTVTGNFTTLQGVTLDKNSATGGALVNSSASNLKIQNVNIQNPGTNSGTGTIALTNGSSVLIDTVNFTTTITDTGISVLPVNSATMDNVVIQNVSGAMGTSLTAFFTDVIVNASGATLSRLSVSRNHLTSTGGCIHVLAGSVGAVVDYHVDQNECYGSGGASSTPDGIAMFAGQHGTVNGNVINDKGQGRAGYPLSLNDMADSVASGNTITNSFGFNSGIRMLDSVRDVVSNNVVNGIGNAVGLNGLLISTAATSGASSDNIIAGNIMTFLGGAAGTCFTIDEGTSSGVTNNTLVSGNKCIGDGSANQVGITFSRSSTGTTNNSRVVGNVLQNLVTGISIGSGVVGTSVGPQTFINTKVEYSDSGTTTHYDPQCHTYTLGVATTNFTVTQDGGPVNNSTVATNTIQSVPLFTLCPLCVVTGITLKNNTAWAATGLTSLLSTVGDSVVGTTLYTSSTYDLRSAVTNTNFQDTSLFKHGTQAGSSVQASLVANQNLNANQLSGSTDYRVCWASQ